MLVNDRGQREDDAHGDDKEGSFASTTENPCKVFLDLTGLEVNKFLEYMPEKTEINNIMTPFFLFVPL